MQLVMQIDVVEVKDVIPLYRLRLSTIQDGVVAMFDHAQMFAKHEQAEDLMVFIIEKLKAGLEAEYQWHDFDRVFLPTSSFQIENIATEYMG